MTIFTLGRQGAEKRMNEGTNAADWGTARASASLSKAKCHGRKHTTTHPQDRRHLFGPCAKRHQQPQSYRGASPVSPLVIEDDAALRAVARPSGAE